MSVAHDRDPLQRYAIVWKSGYADPIDAHQVTLPSPLPDLFGSGASIRDTRVTFHGEIDGHWRLILDADYASIETLRLLGDAEPSTPEAS